MSEVDKGIGYLGWQWRAWHLENALDNRDRFRSFFKLDQDSCQARRQAVVSRTALVCLAERVPTPGIVTFCLQDQRQIGPGPSIINVE